MIAASWWELDRLWLIGQVVLGLCSVIFIHELGHFAVAKACGVKCEKFYLFFDLFGWKLFRFRRGDTEYGIGWLPLGGYVKMLGQDDDPRKAAAELERARLQAEQGGDAPAAPAFDPRSYLAKTVWQRMAIISAGVIMNVIFAVVLASIALSGGVLEEPCVIGSTAPGDPAWQAGLAAGDRVIEIGEKKNPLFKDLRTSVVFGDDLARGVRFLVVREGRQEPLEFRVRPQTRSIFPMIGVKSSHRLELGNPPVPDKRAPASRLDPGLAAGDVIVAVNGVEMTSAAGLNRELYRNRGPLRLRVRRPDEPLVENGQWQTELPAGKNLEFEIPRTPMKIMGFAMEAGPIVGVQDGSPAALAGLKAGDRLVSIDGAPVGDPLFLPEMLRGKSRAKVGWARSRIRPANHFTAALLAGVWWRAFESDSEELSQEIKLRPDLWVEQPYISGQKMTAPTLGVSIEVLNRVASVEADGPAAAAGLKAGDEIVLAKILDTVRRTGADRSSQSTGRS
jgi:regulator of sigma E protease